ncbi:cation/H(+) antiporter 15-like [Momordica charantia]|uniref:Cation/H(+) antiporter 15-like n=1 Tax=Momordica charantia TaxID=3673 RepID=A0A6J1DQR5_MOMCH|nr:cation/H(+) antiporter 15-like [Momordica charantia]
MEPDEIAARQSFKNLTTICISSGRSRSHGVYLGSNPLDYSVPLLLMQLVMSGGAIMLSSQLLKPLGQPLIVSQILGGLVLGSSVLGQFEGIRETLFPMNGFVFLDIVASFGYLFNFFLIGVQIDTSILKKIDKRAFAIGSCTVALPLVLTTIFIINFMNMVDPKIAKSFPMVAATESFVSFPTVACFLSELHRLNSEFGRIALSSSMVCALCSFCVMILGALLNAQNVGRYEALSMVFTYVLFIAIIVVAVRPAILWMMKQNPIGQPLKEGYVITLLVGVLLTGFCCQATGMHLYFGPIALGIATPPGPPMGSALVERLHFITSWVFMPIFFVKIGSVINVFIIKLRSFLVVSFIVFVAALGKFLAAFMVSIYFKLPVRDAVSLGLILNCQGALELGLFEAKNKDKMLDNETFSVMCICMVISVLVITPIIRYLYDPSKKYLVYKRRTMMHSRPESDLHLIVCIYDQDDVPNAINLLEALNPTRRSHLVVHMIHLVELIGSANPQLISHKLMNVRPSRSCPSEQIVNAFKYFGQSNRDIVSIYPFTAISPFETMHDDVCTLALDKSTSLVLVPFHKRFYSNGITSLCKNKMKTVNNHILDNAPCSIALVVDRGLLKVSKSITTNLHSFHVAVVFIGGPDDREAMFIGARMAGHPNINLTMIRILENRNVSSDNVEERRLDDDAVRMFRQIIIGNDYKAMYREEVVTDGTGTVSILRSMENNFDLVMVGRRHCLSSPLVQGLVFWNEDTELGAIGEVLASSDFMDNALILVVQQHTKAMNEDQEIHMETVIPMERHLVEDGAEVISINSKSFQSCDSSPFY